MSDISLTSIESVAADYQGLSTLTTVHSDASSVGQLKRISRDIFDHLAEHLGKYLHYANSSCEMQNEPTKTGSNVKQVVNISCVRGRCQFICRHSSLS